MIQIKKFWSYLTAGIILISSINAQRRFPPGFLFGSGTSAYQIEGAWNRDGKGPNIWDTLTHTHPEKIQNRQNGDVACNSYDKYKEDVQLLKQAGMNFYKFSISWSRIMPNGDPSSLNEAGLRYYDNLITELIANNIEPMVTMFHEDLPQKLQELGGATNPLIADYFEDYADVLFKRYGDRVPKWITFNEPTTTCENGYGSADRAPLVHAAGVGNYLCAHNILISHARIYHLFHEKYFRNGVKIGMTFNCEYTWPSNTNNLDDVIAAERNMQFNCGWFASPIFSEFGGYPQVMVQTIGRNSAQEGRPWSRLLVMTEQLRSYIRGTSDFFGLNYFTSNYGTKRTVTDQPSFVNDAEVNTYQDLAWPLAHSTWLRSVPEGLRAVLNWIKNEYNSPEIYVTENGWSDRNELNELNDVDRINYLKGHLNAILDAIDDGVKVSLHTTWSLLDNFEWMQGFSEGFGIYHVDFNDPNRKRTAKASVAFLRGVIESRVVPN